MKNIILEGSKNHNIFHYQPLTYVQELFPKLVEGKKYKDFFIIKNNKRFNDLISNPENIKETPNVISNGLLSIWSDKGILYLNIGGIEINTFQNVLQNVNDQLITPMFDENLNMDSIILSMSTVIKNRFGKEEKLTSEEKMSDYLLYKFFTRLKGLEKLAIKEFDLDFVKHSLHYNYALHLMLIDVHDTYRKHFKWFLDCLNDIVLLSPDVMDKIKWVEDGVINYKDISSLKEMNINEIVNSLMSLKVVDESLSESLETTIATNYNTIRMNLITAIWYLITNKSEYLLFTDTIPNSNEFLLELKTGIMVHQTTEIEHIVSMHEKVLTSPDYFSELYPVQFCHKHSVFLLTPFKEISRKIPNSIIMLLLSFYQFVKGDLKDDKQHSFTLDKYTIYFMSKIKDLSIINQVEDVFYSKYEKISLSTKIEDRDNKYALNLVKNFEDLEKYQEKFLNSLNNGEITDKYFEDINGMFRMDKNKILQDFEKLERELIENKKFDVVDKKEEKELREELKEERKEKAEETKKMVLFNEQLKYRNELLEKIKELFNNQTVYDDVSMLYETIRIELNNVLKLNSLESVKHKFEDIFQMSMKYVKIKKMDALNKVRLDFVYYTDLYAGIFESEQMIYNGYIKERKKLLEDLLTKNVMIDENNILKDIKEKYNKEENVEIKGLMNELYMAEKIVESMKEVIVDDQKIFEKEQHYHVMHEKYNLIHLLNTFKMHVLNILNKDLEVSTELNDLLNKLTIKHHKNSTLLKIKELLVEGINKKDERLVKFQSIDEKDVYFKELDNLIIMLEKSDKKIMSETAIIKDKITSLSKQLITEIESKEVTSPNRMEFINEIRSMSLTKPAIIENLKQSLSEIFKSIKSDVLKEKVLRDFDNLIFYYMAAIEQGIIIKKNEYPSIEPKKISSCLNALNGENKKYDEHDEIYGSSKRRRYKDNMFGKYSEHKLTCVKRKNEDDNDEDEPKLKKKNTEMNETNKIIDRINKGSKIFMVESGDVDDVFTTFGKYSEHKLTGVKGAEKRKNENEEGNIKKVKIEDNSEADDIIKELNTYSQIFIVVSGTVGEIFNSNTEVKLITEKESITDKELQEIFSCVCILMYNNNFKDLNHEKKKSYYYQAMESITNSNSGILTNMDIFYNYAIGYIDYHISYTKFKDGVSKNPLFEIASKTTNNKLTGRGFGGGGGHGGFGGGHGFGGGIGGHGGFGGHGFGGGFGPRTGGFFRPGYGYGYGYGYPYWLYPGLLAGTLTAAELATWNAYMNSQNYQNPNLYANQGVVYSSNKIVSAPLSSLFHKKTEEETKWKMEALDKIKKSIILTEFIGFCKLTKNGVFNVVKILKGYLVLMLVNNELRIKSNLALYGWSLSEINKVIEYKRTYLSCYKYNKKTKERVKFTPFLHYGTLDIASLMDIYKSIPTLNKVLMDKSTILGILHHPLAESNDVLLTIIKNAVIQNSKWEEIYKINNWSVGDKVREYREMAFHKNVDLLNFPITSKLIKNVY